MKEWRRCVTCIRPLVRKENMAAQEGDGGNNNNHWFSKTGKTCVCLKSKGKEVVERKVCMMLGNWK